MGAPPQPAAVAVPVTNPTRDSGRSQRIGEGQGVIVGTHWCSQSQRQCQGSKVLNKLKILEKFISDWGQTIAEG